MKTVLTNIVVILYIIVAIIVTVCLLNYNEYKVTEFGDKTLIIINDETLEPDYSKGSLVIADKSTLKDTKEGDKIFFYSDNSIKLGEVRQVNQYSGMSSTFVLDGNYQVVGDDVIGNSNSVKVYGVLGTILGIIESKWGFLFLIIFPAVLAFLHEVLQVVMELKSKEN